MRNGVQIGDNCWVGDSVIMLDGASTGHSSIVAAGSVVNTKFPSFSIIGGYPAKLIDRRFSEEKIQLLEKIHWWDWDKQRIAVNKYLFEINFDEISVADLKVQLTRLK